MARSRSPSRAPRPSSTGLWTASATSRSRRTRSCGSTAQRQQVSDDAPTAWLLAPRPSTSQHPTAAAAWTQCCSAPTARRPPRRTTRRQGYGRDRGHHNDASTWQPTFSATPQACESRRSASTTSLLRAPRRPDSVGPRPHRRHLSATTPYPASPRSASTSTVAVSRPYSDTISIGGDGEHTLSFSAVDDGRQRESPAR